MFYFNFGTKHTFTNEILEVYRQENIHNAVRFIMNKFEHVWEARERGVGVRSNTSWVW